MPLRIRNRRHNRERGKDMYNLGQVGFLQPWGYLSYASGRQLDICGRCFGEMREDKRLKQPLYLQWFPKTRDGATRSRAMAGRAGGHSPLPGEKLVVHKYTKYEGCVRVFLSFSQGQLQSLHSGTVGLRMSTCGSSHSSFYTSDLLETAHVSQHVLQALPLGHMSLPLSWRRLLRVGVSICLSLKYSITGLPDSSAQSSYNASKNFSLMKKVSAKITLFQC